MVDLPPRKTESRTELSDFPNNVGGLGYTNGMISFSRSDSRSPEYPREFLVDTAVYDRRRGVQKITEADEAIAVLVNAMEYDLRVSGRITQREQFGVRGPQVASCRASSRAKLLEGAVQPANLVLGKAGAPGQGGKFLREVIGRLFVILLNDICAKDIKELYTVATESAIIKTSLYIRLSSLSFSVHDALLSAL